DACISSHLAGGTPSSAQQRRRPGTPFRAPVRLRPAPPASRAVLIRRATYDMLGPAPPPEEVRAFLADRSPNAWEKVVDRLLASPRYGEKWGRHWLDLVHFAETNSYELVGVTPNAWR